MKNIFTLILNIQPGISVIILLLVLLRPWLKKNYSARLRYWLWIAVALRLLLPFDLSFDYNNKHLIDFNINDREITAPADAVQRPVTDNVQPDGQNDVQISTAPDVSPAPYQLTVISGNGFSIMTAAMYIWLAVAIIKLLSLLRFLPRKRKLTADIRPSGELDMVMELVRLKMNISRKIYVGYGNYSGSPMLVGVIRPVVLFPAGHTDMDRREMIITHELTHFKRGDILLKIVYNIIECVYWFNPLVYLMVKYAGEDIEFSCDEDVIRGKDDDYKADYAQTIINSITAVKNKSLLATNFSSDFYTLKERFGGIFSAAALKKGNLFLALSAMAIVGFTTLTGCSMGQKLTREDRSFPYLESEIHRYALGHEDIEWKVLPPSWEKNDVTHIGYSYYRGENTAICNVGTDNEDEKSTAPLLTATSTDSTVGEIVFTYNNNYNKDTGNSVTFYTGHNWVGQLDAITLKKAVALPCRLYGILPAGEETVYNDISQFINSNTNQAPAYWYKEYADVYVGVYRHNYKGRDAVEITVMDRQYFENWMEKLELRQHITELFGNEHVIFPDSRFSYQYGFDLTLAPFDTKEPYNLAVYDYSTGISQKAKTVREEFGITADVNNYLTNHSYVNTAENIDFDIMRTSGRRGNGIKIDSRVAYPFDHEYVYNFIVDGCYLFNPLIDGEQVYNKFCRDIEYLTSAANGMASWDRQINGVFYHIPLYFEDDRRCVKEIYIMDYPLSYRFYTGEIYKH